MLNSVIPPPQKRSRSAQLLGCKRPRDVSLSLPTAFGFAYRRISSGIFESLDFQLADALNELPDAEFLPQCLVTVVFAADRSECKFIPHTWKELAQADADIGFPLDKTERSAVFASMCYGLEGEAYAKASGLNLIKKLNDSGHFRYGTDCPAAVVLDYQAAQMRKQGRDIEIIVPQDGTFTFALGIFGKTPVCGVPDEKLLEAGFRLMNGECDGALYPPESSYNAASRVTDFKRFNKTVKDITRDIIGRGFSVR